MFYFPSWIHDTGSKSPLLLDGLVIKRTSSCPVFYNQDQPNPNQPIESLARKFQFRGINWFRFHQTQQFQSRQFINSEPILKTLIFGRPESQAWVQKIASQVFYNVGASIWPEFDKIGIDPRKGNWIYSLFKIMFIGRKIPSRAAPNKQVLFLRQRKQPDRMLQIIGECWSQSDYCQR